MSHPSIHLPAGHAALCPSYLPRTLAARHAQLLATQLPATQLPPNTAHMTDRRASPERSLRRGSTGSYPPGEGVPCA